MSSSSYLATALILTLAVALAVAATAWFFYLSPEARAARLARGRLTLRLLPRLPVVLVPGFGAFDKIGPAAVAQDYFRGVAAALREAGVEVIVARVAALGSVPERAAQLAAQLRELPHPRVNVVAHSMGGLDARWAIARLGVADRVATLVTIATPHRGTPLAQAGTTRATRWVRETFARLGFPSEAIDWLTPDAGTRLCVDAPDHPGVRYASVVCRAPAALWRKNPFLYATWIYLGRAAGDNDGIVPTASQHWGEVWLELELDHWGQIGWSLDGAHMKLYGTLLEHLADADVEGVTPAAAARGRAA